MEHRPGIVLFHVIAFQWNVLYPAALGIQQVRSRGQGVDVGPRPGSDGRFPAVVVDT